MLETESTKLPCGYEEHFTIPVDDDLQCFICHLPLREPVLTRCGHRFCRQCLEKHLARLVLYLDVCILFIKTDSRKTSKRIYCEEALNR